MGTEISIRKARVKIQDVNFLLFNTNTFNKSSTVFFNIFGTAFVYLRKIATSGISFYHLILDRRSAFSARKFQTKFNKIDLCEFA